MAKPWKIKHLDPDARLASGLKKLLRTRVNEAFSYASSAVKKEDDEAVHDMRVAVRRLTSMLSIFARCFRKRELKAISIALKNLLATLGDVRDRDIFIASIAGFRQKHTDEAGMQELDRFIEREKRKRNAGRRQLAKLLRSLDRKKFIRRFKDAVDASLARDMTRAGELRFDRSFRQNARVIVPALLVAFMSQADDVKTHPSSKRRLHRMRIDGKRVRYGMESFTEAFGGEYEACLEEVKTLLDMMGTIHDCDMNIPAVERRIARVRRGMHQGMPASGVPDTEGLRGFMGELHTVRAALFGQMEETLERWEKEHFIMRVVHSMQDDAMHR